MDLVTEYEAVAIHLGPVDKSSMGAPQIDEVVVVAIVRDDGVLAGHQRVRKHQNRIGAATDGNFRPRKREYFGATGLFRPFQTDSSDLEPPWERIGILPPPEV